MSTIKKSSTKASKSPAPATKAVTAKPTKKAATPAPKLAAAAATSASAPKPLVAPAAAAAPSLLTPLTPTAVKPVAAKPLVTSLSARVDVGFGNTLTIRGEGGPVLSWTKGLPMECIEADLWRIVFADSARAYTFKFLVNDVTWCTGPDFTVDGGTSVTLTPEF